MATYSSDPVHWRDKAVAFRRRAQEASSDAATLAQRAAEFDAVAEALDAETPRDGALPQQSSIPARFKWSLVAFSAASIVSYVILAASLWSWVQADAPGAPLAADASPMSDSEGVGTEAITAMAQEQPTPTAGPGEALPPDTASSSAPQQSPASPDPSEVMSTPAASVMPTTAQSEPSRPAAVKAAGVSRQAAAGSCRLVQPKASLLGWRPPMRVTECRTPDGRWQLVSRAAGGTARHDPR
jgi:hypothetical protein